MIKKGNPPILGKFGLGGDVVYFKESRTKLSGYGDPIRPHACSDLPSGVLLLNVIPAVERSLKVSSNLTYKIPLLGTALPPNSYQRFDDPEIIPYDSSINLHVFDLVSLDVYISLWRSIGAQTGITGENGTFIWDSIPEDREAQGDKAVQSNKTIPVDKVIQSEKQTEIELS
jgi:hypothetical protein